MNLYLLSTTSLEYLSGGDKIHARNNYLLHLGSGPSSLIRVADIDEKSSPQFVLNLANTALCNRGIAIVDLGQAPEEVSQKLNFFRGVRLLNQLNKVKLSSKMNEWQQLDKKPELCWDETRYNYQHPKKSLTKLCISFPFVANLAGLPAKSFQAYFPTELGDWSSNYPSVVKFFNTQNFQFFDSWRRHIC